MNCQNYRMQITALLDHSLEGDETLLEAHLDSCFDCTKFYNELVELDSLLAAPQLEHRLPAGIWMSVQEQITRVPASSPIERLRDWISLFQIPTRVPAYGLGGLVAVVLLSWGLFRLPAGPDPALMAELDNYTLERLGSENPFLQPARRSNPFLSRDFNNSLENPSTAIGRRP